MIEAFESLRPLIETPSLAALGPERRPDAVAQSALVAKLDAAFAVAPLSLTRQLLIRALILLWHDHLDSSHTLAQDILSADGSYVHGIMHRREPDASNAKYWFHRVGSHPIFPRLAADVEILARADVSSNALDHVIPRGKWDPFAFIDLCESASEESDGARFRFCQRVQRMEFLLLLEHFVRG